MIYVDLEKLIPPQGWEEKAKNLLAELNSKPADQRSDFIDKCRLQTWAHPELLVAIRKIVGNKCWYSEVPLEGADPNVDHFRPKGRVKEVDDKLQSTNNYLPGYWWWAFEWRNFRLASMHSNQRRVDLHTDGGKADFFPVKGPRANEGTSYNLCIEDVIPLDPCNRTDVALLWFDSNGAPSCSDWKRKKSVEDEFRVKVSIWLYHLDKQDLVSRRRDHMDEISLDLFNANTDYELWKTIPGNVVSKKSFETRLTSIKKKISDDSAFSGAKRVAVRAASANFEWIFEFGLLA
ncbi:hypothetical protein ACO0LM_13470 [Undibacterium sp. Di26W]|uniref:hypothetical protein n=1 Tax=Undibacterium sp. Di26W TaxID=3413035 RepID=UPI003BF0A2FC